MKNVYIGTGITENYLQKALPYLESLEHVINNNIKKFVVTVDFKIDVDTDFAFPNIEFIYLDSSTIADELTEKKCLQHGAFLDVIECKEDDIIIFTDSDGVFQRDIEESEYTGYTNGIIGLGINNPKGMTLYDEYDLLQPRAIKDTVLDKSAKEKICYNTGFVIATKYTWALIREVYKITINSIDLIFAHYARQQWNISAIANEFLVYQLPPSVHSHGHHGFPEGCELRDGVLYSIEENKKVFFRHNI